MILALDTSAYTTSIAVIGENQQVICDVRRQLQVASKKQGLRQSEAVFQHVQGLPDLFAQVGAQVGAQVQAPMLKAIAVSTAPRSRDNSYMPVFTVGKSYAHSLAAVLHVPVYHFSHQEGHIASGLWSADFNPTTPFLAFHLSGGTSDVLWVEPNEVAFSIRPMGSSLDLHGGQFVDRVGVALGTPFPAGPTLDRWGQEVTKSSISLPASVRGLNMSFSGPTSAALRYIEAGVSKEEIAWAVFRCIANTVEKVVRNVRERYPFTNILFVGGVASNTHLRQRLVRRLPFALHYGEPKFSTDNAVGIGLLGLEKWKTEAITETSG